MDFTAPAPKKRSLFTQAALSKKTRIVNPDDLIFNRAKELEAERMAEEERKRKKRIVKLEKKRSSQSVEMREDTGTPPKRRKISAPVEDKDGNNSESSSGPEEPEEPTWERRDSTVSTPGSGSRMRPSSANCREAQQSPSKTLSARYSASLQQDESSKGQQKNYISVLDSDSDSPSVPFRAQGNQPISIDDDDDDIMCISGNLEPKATEEDPYEEEEEFPELLQRAREREKLRLQQAADASKSFTEQNHLQDTYDDFGTEPAKEIDPSIEILITSRMQGTVPLKVKRKLSQRLAEARFAWCDRQDPARLSVSDLKDSIFLTWKQKRLYDVSSCVAFGLNSDGGGVQEGRIHLEAWTEEAYAVAQKEETAVKKREECESEDEEPEVQEEVIKIKLVLKAKDMEPVKLTVKPDTLISRLVTAFATMREIPEGQKITLWLDGDELDPEDAIEDTELEELDTIEVHIK